MALPNLRPPSSAPDFLLDGHSLEIEALHDDIKVQQGEAIKRKSQTFAPRFVSVSWILEADVATAVEAWLQNGLRVISEPFTARIAPLGGDGIYWAAQWVEQPNWEPLDFGRWMLTGQLYLTGEGSDVAPGPAPLAIEFELALSGVAGVEVPADLAIEFELALTSGLALTIDFELALLQDSPSYELREDDGSELREDGGRERRE